MKNNKKQNYAVVDERQKQIRSKAGVVSGAFLLICIIISGIYNIAVTGDPGWELWALIGYPIVFGISCHFLGDIEQPRDVMGRPLPVGKSPSDKKARMKNYVLESVIFALACAVMDVILIGFGANDITEFELVKKIFPNMTHIPVVIITSVFSFIIMFLMSLLVEYLVDEKFRVPKYNKTMEALQNDDDEE